MNWILFFIFLFFQNGAFAEEEPFFEEDEVYQLPSLPAEEIPLQAWTYDALNDLYHNAQSNLYFSPSIGLAFDYNTYKPTRFPFDQKTHSFFDPETRFFFNIQKSRSDDEGSFSEKEEGGVDTSEDFSQQAIAEMDRNILRELSKIDEEMDLKQSPEDFEENDKSWLEEYKKKSPSLKERLKAGWQSVRSAAKNKKGMLISHFLRNAKKLFF
jgi:hypothetical protein